MLNSTFATASEKVVAEQFENEVVVVNLESGAYFSLRGSGVPIWSALTNQVTPAEVAERLADAAGIDVAAVRHDLERFLRTLIEDGLVERTEGAARPWNGLADLPSEYTAPVIEKYTDMEDLLLLDPVHDVDESGWPKKKDSAEQAANAS